MSSIRVDFPDPDTPVTLTNIPSGIFTSIRFRLCSRAPRIHSASPLPRRRRAGTEMTRRPERYWPVIESGALRMRSSGPEATTRPPCAPAPGPMSTIQSADRIVSSSCSTTRMVFPRSRSRASVSISRRLSRWCRPMLGSSSTYSTPISPEPICVASRIRCASPPDRVLAVRSRVR